MYIIGVESSKQRGMGHFFRSLLYVSFLESLNRDFMILINNDEPAVNLLKKRGIPFLLVDYEDCSDWQTPIIKKYKVDVWLQDKFETSWQMASNIKKNNVLLCAIDEFGPGAALCDIHFAGMIYLTGNRINGKKVYYGPKYVVLNPEIDCYKRIRTGVDNVIVSLGGSDPYGMTVDVVKQLNQMDLPAEVVIGPDFEYRKELETVNINNYPILQNVPSLIKEFSRFDFAITGGGITCCEANSCGLPCMIIANAPHEIHTGIYMQRQGGAIYAGSYESWDKTSVERIRNLNAEEMSRAGMENFDTKAIDRIFSIIEQEIAL